MATTVARRESPDDDLKQVLDTARAALDQEFARAERYDSKARDRATLAGSWYAVVQAATALSLTEHTATGWVIAIASEALVGAFALVMVLYGMTQVAKLRTRPTVSDETLEAMKLAALGHDEEFGVKSIDLYRNLLFHAQELNDERAAALDSGQIWWWAVVLVGIAQLLTALLSRAVA